MSSDSSENVATQAVTVEKLLSATHVAYLSGFNLLLILILRSFHDLVSMKRRLEASNLAMTKQALGAQKAYDQLSEQQSTDEASAKKKKKKDEGDEGGAKKTGGDGTGEAERKLAKLASENKELLAELSEAKKAEKTLRVDNDALLRQSKSQSEEYKRLVAAHASLRDQMQEADEYMLIDKSQGGGKKDN